MVERAEIERFVKALFGQAAAYDGPAFVCSLFNGNGGGERKLLTRSLDDLCRHAERWNGKERGLYICTNLLRPGERSRNKNAIGQIVTLHVDTDFKTTGLSRDEALARILALPHVPTMIVESGGGLHLYWVLSDPLNATADNVAMAEMLNGLAADVVGGDTQARDVSRLLRLPGTHNTKNGEMRPVRIAEYAPDRLHDIADLEEWLSIQSPVIKRIVREASAPAAENPYLAAARLLGFRPPLDVEEALDAMAYQGGECSIHETQLRVSASLLARGTAVDEVVAVLMDATQRAAGEFGARWNWKREEASIRRMCTDWLKKHPEILEAKAETVATASEDADADEDGANPFSSYAAGLEEDDDEEPAQANGTNGGKGAQVVRLADRRQKAEPKAKKGSKDKASHVVIAKTVLAVIAERGEDILFIGSDLWRYIDGLWSCEPDKAEAWLKVEIERACRGLNITSDNKLIGEVRGYIQRDPDCFHAAVAWDTHGLVPARNGLFDPETGAIRSYRPEDRATWRLEADYVAGATCPAWLRLLNDLFAAFDAEERDETIQALQEFIGCQIIVGERRRSLRAALGLTGMPNSGKSQITETIREIIGRPRCTSIMFKDLDREFRLEPLARARALVVDEAVDDKTEIASSIFKALVTGEPIPVNRKNRSIVELAFNGPIVFTANDWPYASDTTSGFADRLIIIQCPSQFTGPAIGVAAEAFAKGYSKPWELIAATELPGLMNWALEGWRRAKERGALSIPQRSQDIRQRVADSSSPILPFIRECIVVKDDKRSFVQTPAVYAVFKEWYVSQHGDGARPYGPKKFWNKMAVNLPRLSIPGREETRHAGHSIGIGIHLSKAGLEIWEAIKAARYATSASVPTWLTCSTPNHARDLARRTQDASDTNGSPASDSEMPENPANPPENRRPRF